MSISKVFDNLVHNVREAQCDLTLESIKDYNKSRGKHRTSIMCQFIEAFVYLEDFLTEQRGVILCGKRIANEKT